MVALVHTLYCVAAPDQLHCVAGTTVHLYTAQQNWLYSGVHLVCCYPMLDNACPADRATASESDESGGAVMSGYTAVSAAVA